MTPLSTLLREGSAAEHRDAESSSFVSELLAGRVDAAEYVAYLSRLREVYAALEQAARCLATDPIAAEVVDPRLDRLAAIDADLAFWGGPLDGDSPAVRAYVARIEEASGPTFVAHHYTRYLGDLSGGRAIGRILARTFDLGADGVAFYAFPHVPRPKPYKDAYRARLDALPLDEAGRSGVLAEVRIAFGLNGALFAELNRA